MDKETKISPVDQEYYDKDYFENGAKQIVDKVTGEKKVWGYQGTDWSGNYHIIQGILKTLKGEVGSVLDVGAGQGSFTDYALRCGLVAKGYDFSEWAVNNPLNYAKGHLFRGDATNLPEEDNSYDLIFCSDMLEHIKKSEVPKVISELRRITRKWVFLQFPIVHAEHEIFDAEIHGEDHKLYAHFMIAGHLNMQLRDWWVDLFKKNNFKIREELETDFRTNTPREVIVNWLNIAMLEK